MNNNTNAIVTINTSELYAHPQNPRKNVGFDEAGNPSPSLMELSDSIKANGLLQNLTIMEGHYENGAKVAGGYTILIGHRRWTAAKIAGVTELPCRIVSGLTPADEIAIMVIENCARKDLSIIEQAQSFEQLRLFGLSEKDIADRTGFSARTVSHRLAIAKLDQKVLAEKDNSFQLSITDLMLLEKLPTIEDRNAILNSLTRADGIPNAVSSRLYQIKRDANKKKIMEVVNGYGIPIATKDQNYWLDKIIVSFRYDDDPEEFAKKIAEVKGLNNTDYYYVDNSWEIKLVKIVSKKDPNHKTEAQLQKEALEAKRRGQKDVLDGMLEERRTVIERIVDGSLKPIGLDGKASELFNALLEYTDSAYLPERAIYGMESWKVPADKKETIKATFMQQPMEVKMLSFLNEVTTSPIAYDKKVREGVIKCIMYLDDILEDCVGFFYEDESAYKLLETLMEEAEAEKKAEAEAARKKEEAKKAKAEKTA